MKEQLTYEQALGYAMHYCSKAEKCKSEVLKKLYEKNADPRHFDKIINTLVDNRYLDDARYARLFVIDKFKFNKWGRIKIKTMLLQKQIPDKIICEALSLINESEYLDMLKNVIKTKQKTLRDSNPLSVKDKLFRHAASKGFELSLISDFLGRI